jgi:hypothetical protein
MQLLRRSLLLGVFALMTLSACKMDSPWGSGGVGSDYGTSPATGGTGGSGSGGTAGKGGVGGEGSITGAQNSVVATPSVEGVVSVMTGASQTVSVAFTSNDGLAISGFGISGSLATLPAGWSGPGSFTCASVSSGSGCVLNLTYAPTVVGSGTLTLNYIFVDSANIPRTPGGSLTLSYAATPNNNVVAATSPAGQINAIVGAGSQSVSVNFTTDDGNAATDLILTTNLAALPPGWSSTAASLTCAIVSTGSGCQLPLIYAPTASGRGALTLNFSFTDDAGMAKTGAVNIAYATTSADNVIATASPTGQINAIEKTGGQAVAVTFTTDDGKAASALSVTSELTSLPPGWSSTSGQFSCGSVSTGNGCQLPLHYAPTSLTSGTLTLNYAYHDSAGTAQTGLLNLTYAATTNDNVVAAASPSGQINAVVGMGSQSVAVTFTTDDGRPATALQLTSSLTALPAGWSSSNNSFACSGLSSGSGCQLTLMYAPPAAAAGTLTLGYAYKNNAGESRTGSINIPYRATTNDNVVGTASQPSLSVLTGSSTIVNVPFTTDDGNLATGLSVTSGLSSLPAGWSSTTNTFSCASLSVGTGCQLSLTYTPTAAATGTLTLGFTYTNDSGIVKTGTVTVAYTAS